MHYCPSARPQARHLFLHTAVEARQEGLPARLVVLRAPDGGNVAVPEAEFRRDWQLAPDTAGTGGVSVEAVRETLAGLRAHSTIRFVALPFIVLALAVLAKAFHTNEVPRWSSLAAGLGLSMVAVVLEVVLSRNLVAGWAALRRALDGQPEWAPLFAHREPRALWAVRLALFAPYAVALAYWAGNAVRWLAWEHRVLPFDPRPAAALVAVAVVSAAYGIAIAVWRRAEADPAQA